MAEKKERQFGNRVQAKKRISGDVKRCLDTAVSGTLIQVTSYPGARPPDAFTGVSFRFVPLPHHSFFCASSRTYREFSSSLEASFSFFCSPLRDDRLPTKSRAHDNIRIEERNSDESPNDNVRISSRNVNCHLKSLFDEKAFCAIQIEFYLGTRC